MTDQIPIQHIPNPHNEAYPRQADRLGHTLHHQGIALDEEMLRDEHGTIWPASGPSGTRNECARRRGVRVALCVATFYTEVADKLEAGAREALEEAGVAGVDRFEVPGAFELPLIAKYAAQSQRYGAIVCLGAVIRDRPLRLRVRGGRPRIGGPSRRPACRAVSASSPSTRWLRHSTA